MSDAEAFERCVSGGGVAVFPADTVYGLACAAADAAAVRRLYALKRRPPAKASAVMFFDLERALAAVPELGPRTRAALERLLPGAVTVVVPNPAARFPLACGEDRGALGLRVPVVPALAAVRVPVLQSSANLAGGSDTLRLADVPASIRAGADLVIDGGELPGTPSSVVDLRRYEDEGDWLVLREGAVGAAALSDLLGGDFHFDPATYAVEVRDDIPAYEELQAELVRAGGGGAARILELGTGTGETAARLLDAHPGARLVGLDASAEMLAAARAALPAARVELAVARLEAPLPPGPFDLVASALCVHHLPGAAKTDLFRRIAGVLAPGGRFVLADVVLPEDPAAPRTPWTPGFDHPSSVAEQLGWLREAGFEPALTWSHGDLAVIAAALRETDRGR